MHQGDIVVCSLSGDYGKPRPAVIIQSDLFNSTHSSIVVCPITSHLVEAPLFRISLKPNKNNGLKNHSQIMVDKMTAMKREKIKNIVGKLTPKESKQLNESLKLWLNLLD